MAYSKEKRHQAYLKRKALDIKYALEWQKKHRGKARKSYREWSKKHREELNNKAKETRLKIKEAKQHTELLKTNRILKGQLTKANNVLKQIEIETMKTTKVQLQLGGIF